MIRRFLAALLVCGTCFGLAAEAADVPFSTLAKKAKEAKPPLVRKKLVEKPKAPKAKIARSVPPEPKPVAVVAPAVEPPIAPVVAPDAAVAKAPEDKSLLAERSLKPVEPAREIDLSWVLGPLVATADGSKREGSSSVEGNLVVVEPGYVTSGYMVVELSGHIVKSPDTTARLDVYVAGVHRTLNWKSEDIKSGRFKVALQLPMQEGKLPAYLPVSAIAFATKAGKQGAAMLSLEKISVRIGNVNQVAAQ